MIRLFTVNLCPVIYVEPIFHGKILVAVQEGPIFMIFDLIFTVKSVIITVKIAFTVENRPNF